MRQARKSKERARLNSIYGHLYGHHISDHLPHSLGCFYCGDIAQTKDHSPPLAWVETKKQKEWRDDGIEFLTVRSCSWCNIKLGEKPLFTLAERSAFIEKTLMRQYEKESALWSEDEILEMSSAFQKTIRARKKAIAELLTRARTAEWRKIREMAGCF